MRRNLTKERQEYERMWENQPEAQREYTARHFSAIATQHPDGCDTGRKVAIVFDSDEITDEESSE